MKCTQRLYLTADRKRVVGDGDKKAATLYAVPGDEIPQSAADAFGLVDGHLKGFDPDAKAAAEEKAAADAAAAEASAKADAEAKAKADAEAAEAAAKVDAEAAAKEAAAGQDKELKTGSDKESADQAETSGEKA